MRASLWRFVKMALLLAALAMIVFSDLKEHRRKLRLLPTQAELDSVLPGSLIKDRREKPIPYYPGKLQTLGGTQLAAALLTAELPPRVRGFTDQINILFSIDQEGHILKLRVISQRETPYYFRLVRSAGFLDKILGQPYRQLSEIKVVSGASISSKAILDDLQTSAALALNEIFHQPVSGPQSPSLLALYLAPRYIALMLVLLLGLSARFYKSNWLRWLVFASSVAVIGFWLKTPFSLPHIFQLLSLRVPLGSNPYLAIMGGFVILTTILSGPLWCAHLCPYAALQEFFSRLGKNYRWRPSPGLLRAGRELRGLILFAAVLLYFGLGIRSGAELEPFFHLFTASWTGLGLALVGVTLLGSFFIPRFWCRFFCPTGACLILLSSHRKFFRQIEQGVNSSEIDQQD